MAELKKVLEKEVTCPLCLDLFREPKKLSCDHVYCKGCIEGLTQHSTDATITCPECRTVTNVPNDDINLFPTAFRVNRLVEAFKAAKEGTESYSEQDCAVHKDQPLAIYCETCKSLLCRDCVIMSKEHVAHEYDYITNIATTYSEKHTKNLQMTEKYCNLLSKTHSQISNVEKTIVLEETAYLEEIDHAFELLQKALEANKVCLKSQLSQVYQSALESVLEDKRQIETVQAETAHVLSLVEDSLGSKNKALIMIRDEMIDKNVSKIQNQIEQFRLTIDNPSLPIPEVMSCTTLEKYLATCNFLYMPPDPKNCFIEESSLMPAEMGDRYVLIMNMADSTGKGCMGGSQTIKAELCSCQNGAKSLGRTDFLSPGKFSVTFEPQNRGRNELIVTVRGTQVANSPQSVFVGTSPSQYGQPVARRENLEQPSGLTCCRDLVMVVEHSRNRILKFNRKLEFEVVSIFSHEELSGPAELTVDKQSNVYVTTLNDKVHKFTSDGVHVKSTGSSGAQRGQFNFPNGLCISSWNELYVCDSKNNRLQVFDLDLNFKRILGGPGMEKGQFLFPSDVDFDSKGNIYVCDNYNHRIQVFTPRERFLFIIGNRIFRSRILKHPVNLRVFKELLFVTQNHQILVFKLSGELVRTFGQGIVHQPEGLEVDEDGYVYVSTHCSKVVIF